MPIYVERPHNPDCLLPWASGSRTVSGGACKAPLRPDLTIGLLNNMKNGAVEATERQFLSLLDSASEGLFVRVQLYSMFGYPTGKGSRRNRASGYSGIDQLEASRLDGLIVTGREPSALDLRDEPYWDNFVRTLNWAASNTRSTIWSCLAAHAAVLYLDGIPRVPRTRKCSGIFECTRRTEHHITAGLPTRFSVPHSRWNGIDESRLAEHGYQVLTATDDAGVDSFVREEKSLFVFFQGHPEYESNTLLLEYRRDASRYFRGEANSYPSTPQNYLDPSTTEALEELRKKAHRLPREELTTLLASILQSAHVEHEWRPRATALYSNWLNYLHSRKMLPSGVPAYTRTTSSSVDSNRLNALN